MKTNILSILSLFVAASFLLSSCSDSLLEKKPEQENLFVGTEAIKSAEDLEKLNRSVYDVAANLYGGQIQNFSELLGDNLNEPNAQNDYTQIYTRRTDFFNGNITDRYKDAYISIYRANVVLEKIEEFADVTPEQKTRLEAEAKFLRAFNHYSLVNLWAQPFGFSPGNNQLGIVIRDRVSQEALPRATVDEVYRLILSDLEFAEANLPDQNGIYATRWAAKALLSRIYLTMNRYDRAGALADEIIKSNRFQLDDSLHALNRRYASGSNSEQIFTVVSYNGPNGPANERGRGFVDNYRIDGAAPNPSLRALPEFYNLATADTNDLRGKNWYRVINPGGNNEFIGILKFNALFMWVPVIHYTEMILTRAEAFAASGTDQTTALNDLNSIRVRAGLEPLDGLSGQALINAIRAERRLEMAFEGDRTTQLKRLGALGQNILSRGAPWNCPGMVLQFPNAENSSLGFVMNPTGGCN